MSYLEISQQSTIQSIEEDLEYIHQAIEKYQNDEITINQLKQRIRSANESITNYLDEWL